MFNYILSLVGLTTLRQCDTERVRIVSYWYEQQQIRDERIEELEDLLKEAQDAAISNGEELITLLRRKVEEM